MKTLKEIRVIRILDAIADELEIIANNMRDLANAVDAKEIQPHRAIKMFRKLADRAALISKRDASILAKYGKEFGLCDFDNHKVQDELELRIERYVCFFTN